MAFALLIERSFSELQCIMRRRDGVCLSVCLVCLSLIGRGRRRGGGTSHPPSLKQPLRGEECVDFSKRYHSFSNRRL